MRYLTAFASRIEAARRADRVVSPPVGAATLEQVRMKLEAGYDAYGTIHGVLQMWNRVDPAGMPDCSRAYMSALA